MSVCPEAALVIIIQQWKPAKTLNVAENLHNNAESTTSVQEPKH